MSMIRETIVTTVNAAGVSDGFDPGTGSRASGLHDERDADAHARERRGGGTRRAGAAR